MLRSGTRRWAPKNNIKKDARVKRGVYLCAGCGTEGPATLKIDGKSVKNAVVDHINPVVDPSLGFTNWDEYIEGMFCEEDNLQLLCHECHEGKSKNERDTATARRASERD